MASGRWAELDPSAWAGIRMHMRAGPRQGWEVGGWGLLEAPVPVATKIGPPGFCLGPYTPLSPLTPTGGGQWPEPWP